MHYYLAFTNECPRCGNEWKLDVPWHVFDYRCEVCHLVSMEANTEATSLEELHP